MSTNLKYGELYKFASEFFYACSSDLFFLTCQIPFIALYRKENCLSLLEEEDIYYEDLNSKDEPLPKARFHKVILTIGSLF
jgi:hypothetical protein